MLLGKPWLVKVDRKLRRINKGMREHLGMYKLA
jgi:hypothetical protein